MKHHLTYKDDKSDKFWNIEVSGKSFTVTYGKTGTAGQTQTKTFGSEEECQKEAKKLLQEKLKKGYAEGVFPKDTRSSAKNTSSRTVSSMEKNFPISGDSYVSKKIKEFVASAETALRAKKPTVFRRISETLKNLDSGKITKALKCELTQSLQNWKDTGESGAQALFFEWGGMGISPFSGEALLNAYESCAHQAEDFDYDGILLEGVSGFDITSFVPDFEELLDTHQDAYSEIKQVYYGNLYSHLHSVFAEFFAESSGDDFFKYPVYVFANEHDEFPFLIFTSDTRFGDASLAKKSSVEKKSPKEHTIDIKKQNEFGETAIFEAVLRSKSLTDIKALVELGSDIRHKNMRDQTLLHFAAKCQTVEVIQYLVNLGLDVNAEDDEGNLPLHDAVERGEAVNAEFLIQNGAAMNRQNEDGNTPLHIAVKENNSKIVKILLDAGANTQVRNKRGDTPEECATKVDIRKLLNPAWPGADGNPFSGFSQEKLNAELLRTSDKADRNKIPKLKQLLDAGADILAKAIKVHKLEVGYSVLHYGRYDLDVVKFLVESGADVNAVSSSGESPLFFAIWSRDPEIVKYLVAQGADVNHRDEFGKTALHHAVINENAKMAEILRSLGADEKIRDAKNKSPDDYAK
ncbi:ankyrin repeat domain-containing protein [Leptospira weilii]|uniref:ankyrin repeat domain-containing protein n=1 Tax=Leptospira weilii TaxID=28184 RepID=UPI0009BE39A0|nr:ankyrin repeat domain-containing protein [Leptospira weilii]